MMCPRWLVSKLTDVVRMVLPLRAGRGVQHKSGGNQAAEWEGALCPGQKEQQGEACGKTWLQAPG